MASHVYKEEELFGNLIKELDMEIPLKDHRPCCSLSATTKHFCAHANNNSADTLVQVTSLRDQTKNNPFHLNRYPNWRNDNKVFSTF